MVNSRSDNWPTLAEVEDYAAEIESSVDPERFYDYYSKRNWSSKGGPIADWKAVLKSWEKYEKPKKYGKVKVHIDRQITIDKDKLQRICKVFNLGPEDIGEETYRVLFRD